jgi:transcriptional regulator with XRE-family HTH domain
MRDLRTAMKTSKPPSFARALRAARKAKQLPQEAFDQASSRTYVSALERGLKSPTISKITELAGVCDVHPLTLLLLSFSRSGKRAEFDQLLATVSQELDAIEIVDL